MVIVTFLKFKRMFGIRSTRALEIGHSMLLTLVHFQAIELAFLDSLALRT